MINSEIRKRNRELGNTCGNCALGSKAPSGNMVCCAHLASLGVTGEALFFRKNKGGCGKWVKNNFSEKEAL